MQIENNKPIANSLIVLREEFDNWAILFDPDSGEAKGLNPTGVFIWKLLDGTHTMRDIASEVSVECKNVPDNIESDVKEFVSSLTERGWAGYELKKG